MIRTVESHTEGMPTRVVIDGVGTLPGATMEERRQNVPEELRTFLMLEPRGHGAMSGALLQPAIRPDADWGVVYVEVAGCLPMCGHGTIGVATVLVEQGLVEVTEPETIVRLDVPAGLVEARVRVEDGHARSVTIRNVPSYFVAAHDGYDLAYGGNHYAIADAAEHGLTVAPEHAGRLIAAGMELLLTVPEPDLQARDLGRREPQRRRHPPRLPGPLALRHRHERPHGPAAPPRRARHRGGLRPPLRDRQLLHRPPRRRDRPGRHTGDHRPRLDHRHGPVHARPHRPFPRRIQALVVGSGICGSATALFLQDAGVEVLLLERGALSGATTGLGEGNVLVADAPGGHAVWHDLAARFPEAVKLRAKGSLTIGEDLAGANVPEASVMEPALRPGFAGHLRRGGPAGRPALDGAGDGAGGAAPHGRGGGRLRGRTG